MERCVGTSRRWITALLSSCAMACSGAPAPARTVTAPQPAASGSSETAITSVTVEPPAEDSADAGVTVTHGDPATGATVSGAQEQPTSRPSAPDRVRSLVSAAEPVAADEAAWFPFRVLEAVARASGDLPAPTPPDRDGDRVVWSLVAPATAAPADERSLANVCDEVARAEPRIACASDTVLVGAAQRTRFAFAWRRAPGTLAADLALPLRALGRLSTGACLLSAERTLHTLELRVQFPSVQALGTSLALIATVPDLSDVIMVEAQPAPASSGAPAGSLRATLSWPTDRVDREQGDLGNDVWPARCGDRLALGADAAAGARPAVLAVLRGQRGRGAVLNLNHREWLATEGDTVGDATVTAVADNGVYVRRGDNPRARPVLLRAPNATTGHATRGAPVAGSAGAGPHHGEPIRLPLPPEPPAVPPPPPDAPAQRSP